MRHSAVIPCLALLLAMEARARWDDPEAGLPLLRPAPPHESFDPYFTSAAVDRLGRLYCAGDHVYEYNGAAWSVIAVGQGNILRALELDGSDRLWCGGINELGHLDADAMGKRTFRSLMPHLPPDATTVNVYDIFALGDRTLFVDNDSVLVWDGAAFVVHPMPTERRLFSFAFEGVVHVSQPGVGLWRWDGSRFTAVDLGGAERDTIQAAWRDSRHRIVYLAQDHLLRSGDSRTEAFAADLIARLRARRIARAVPLPDGEIAVLTVTAGIIVISRDGEELRQVDRTDGLPSSTISQVLPGRNGRAWVTHSAGAFEFDARHRQTLFNEKNGLASDWRRVVTDNRGLTFASTAESVGHLVTEPGRAAAFRRLSFLNGSYNDLAVLGDGTVIAGGMREFLRITPDEAHPLATTPQNILNLAVLARDRPLVAAAEGDAIAIFDLERDQPRLATIPGFPEPVMYLAVDASDTLWAAFRRAGVAAVDWRNGSKPVQRHLVPGHDLPNGFFDPGLFILGGDAYAYTQDRIVALPKSTGGPAHVAIPDTGLIMAERSGAGEVWAVAPMAGRDARLVRLTKEARGELEVHAMDQGIPDLGRVVSLSRTGDHTLWIGALGGLVRIDTREVANPPPLAAPVLQAVTWRAGDDATRLPLAEAPMVAYARTGAIEFQLADPGDPFAARPSIETRLAGSDAPWRLSGRSRVIAGLDEGRFTFEARVAGFRGQAGPVLRYTFTISPPWFRTPLAYAAYVLAFGGSLVGAAQWRTRRIRHKNAQLEQLVNRRTEELAQAVSARSAFLANMGHEIRNPLNGVVGLVNTLRARAVPPDQKEIVDRIGTCADQLVSVIDDVLEYARVDAGRIALRKRPFAVREPVDAAIDIFRAARPDAVIELSASTDVLAAQIVGDPDRVRHILVNYLANALKFGGGTPVTVAVRRDGPLLVFGVTDRGPGVSPEEQARLFVRFSRGSLAYKNAVPGTGLGLAACKAYAEAMGGDVSVESELGHGATFFLRVPFHAVTAETPAPAPTSPDILVGRHALVVDDQDFNRIVLNDLLGRMGASTTEAANIEQARAAFRARVPDLVFTDYDLSGATGADLAEWIRKEAPAGRDVPIISTTAFEVDEVRERCEEAGMDGFLAKPVTAQRLADLVAQIERVRSGGAMRQEPPSPGTGPSSSSFLDILAGGDPARRAELERSSWGEVLTEALAAHRALHRSDAPIVARHAHRLVSAALVLGHRELVSAARELNAVAKAGDLVAARDVAARLRRHIRAARANRPRSGPTSASRPGAGPRPGA